MYESARDDIAELYRLAHSVSNAGIVDVGEFAIIFDTFNTQQASKDLKQSVYELTGHSKHYVINSHWHGDHIRGNQVFKDSIIFSTTKTFNEMKRIHPERINHQKSHLSQLEKDIKLQELKLQEIDDGVSVEQLRKQLSFLREIAMSLPSLELTLPSVTFESRLVFNGSIRSVEVIPLGSGHTLCDTVLYIPDERILFAADLCTNANHPLLVDGNPENWISILDHLLDKSINTVIPGHGRVGSVDILQSTREYIHDVIELAKLNSNTVNIPIKYEAWSASENFHRNLQHLVVK